MKTVAPRLRRHPLGFFQVDPSPSPEQLKKYYAERYYQTEQGGYRKTYSDAERAFLNLKIAQKAHLVASLRGHGAPGSFLDVGCGEGFALAWFRKEGWFVEGIDYSIAGLEAMNPELISAVKSGDLSDILHQRIIQGGCYDLVWLNNVLEHVIDPISLLTSLRRLVAPRGMLVATVPNDGSDYQEALLENGDIPERFWITVPDHLTYFTYESLRCTTEATGWACRDIIADFPIDFFLLHPGSNYVRVRSNGAAAHLARVRMELMLGKHSHDRVAELYRALARVGLGRNLTAFLMPK